MKGIEAAMVTHNALYHQACKLKYNNTKLQRAEKRTFMTEGEINDAPGACKRTIFHSRSSRIENAQACAARLQGFDELVSCG